MKQTVLIEKCTALEYNMFRINQTLNLMRVEVGSCLAGCS